MKDAIINTTEATEILNYSPQNIDDLTRRGKSVPIKSYPHDKLFFKADVEVRVKND